MPEMHLKQPGFTYSVCGPSHTHTLIHTHTHTHTHTHKTEKFIQSGDADFIYKNELDKAHKA